MMDETTALLFVGIGTAIFAGVGVGISLLLIFDVLFRGGYQRYVDLEAKAQRKRASEPVRLEVFASPRPVIQAVLPYLLVGALAISSTGWLYIATRIVGIRIPSGLNLDTALIIQGIFALVFSSSVAVHARRTNGEVGKLEQEEDTELEEEPEKIRSDTGENAEVEFLDLSSKIKTYLEKNEPEKLMSLLGGNDRFMDTAFWQRLVREEGNTELLLNLARLIEDGMLPRKALARLRVILHRALASYWEEMPEMQIFQTLEMSLKEHSAAIRMRSFESIASALPYTIKRLFDIVLALLILFLAIGPVPVLPAIVLALLIQDFRRKEPIFFVTTRAGVGGKPFRLYQFRTLLPDESTGRHRLTRFGSFLIWSGLDRLPILFNIVMGTMSFVGPHGLYIEQSRYIVWSKIMDNEDFAWRQSVRPGVTGISQITGAKNPDPHLCPNCLSQEVDYVRNWSLKADVVIMWQALLLYIFFGLPNAVLYLLRWPRKMPPVEKPLWQLPKWLSSNRE